MAKEPSEELITKKDLQATKDELLQNLASKAELAEVKHDVGVLKEDMGALTQRVERLETSVDRLAIQVSKNTESIGKMVTREEFNERMNQIADGQDRMMVILERLDKERIFTTEWVKDRS